MRSHEFSRPHDTFGSISRRGLLKGAAALAVTPSSLALTQGQANSPNGPILAYVCGYSGGRSPERTKANEHGIFLFHMDPATGALSRQKIFADDSDPGWLAFDSSGTHLYAANETETFQGTKSGSVSAFSVDRSNGELTLLSTVSSQGAGPCYLALHPSGKYLLVANFSGGSVAVFTFGQTVIWVPPPTSNRIRARWGQFILPAHLPGTLPFSATTAALTRI
jgi:6-phosphogluconolactonase